MAELESALLVRWEVEAVPLRLVKAEAGASAEEPDVSLLLLLLSTFAVGGKARMGKPALACWAAGWTIFKATASTKDDWHLHGA